LTIHSLKAASQDTSEDLQNRINAYYHFSRRKGGPENGVPKELIKGQIAELIEVCIPGCSSELFLVRKIGAPG